MAVRSGSVAGLLVAVLAAACTAEPTTTPSVSPSVPSSVTPSVTPPDAVPPSASPLPTSTPMAVADNAEADALFATPDTCTNPTVLYTVTFPDDWYTNTRVGDQKACTWFTPDFFEVDVPGETPEEIWISIGLVDGLIGYNMLTPVESSEEVEIDGLAGHRAEFRVLESIGDTESAVLTYHYVIPFETDGPTLVATTNVVMADDYELSKAVLDRIMASMQLEPLIPVGLAIPEALPWLREYRPFTGRCCRPHGNGGHGRLLRLSDRRVPTGIRSLPVRYSRPRENPNVQARFAASCWNCHS